MEAYLYRQLKDKKVRCDLCSHRCVIKPGDRGICGVRENRGGILETLVFGNIIARNIDPVEKKPLFHFQPGSRSYSVATVGCNFKCLFCQNADIAQMPADRKGMIAGKHFSPEEIVKDAVRNHCKNIAYTYTEPTVFFEFAYETAKLAHQQGLRNIFVTNGYMSAEALEMIRPYLDAANVDLKAFTGEYYRNLCSARLEPVKETLRLMKSMGIFIEVTTLIIPGLNDDPDELAQMAHFIVSEIGSETPWHISRFHPTYKLTDRGITPLQTLLDARQIGLDAGLRYVYPGNVPGESGESTTCYQCGSLLIERRGFIIRQNRISESKCPDCGATIDGVELSG